MNWKFGIFSKFVLDVIGMFLNFLLFVNIHRKLPGIFDFSKNNFYKKDRTAFC